MSLLEKIGAVEVALKNGEERKLITFTNVNEMIARGYDLREIVQQIVNLIDSAHQENELAILPKSHRIIFDLLSKGLVVVTIEDIDGEPKVLAFSKISTSKGADINQSAHIVEFSSHVVDPEYRKHKLGYLQLFFSILLFSGKFGEVADKNFVLVAEVLMSNPAPMKIQENIGSAKIPKPSNFPKYPEDDELQYWRLNTWEFVQLFFAKFGEYLEILGDISLEEFENPASQPQK